MASSERIVVLLTDTQKATITARAAAAGLSASEYVRRRALEDDLAVSTLLEDLATPAVNAALDAAVAWLDEADARRATRDSEARAKARAEFADIDPGKLVALLDAARTEAA